MIQYARRGIIVEQVTALLDQVNRISFVTSKRIALNIIVNMTINFGHTNKRLLKVLFAIHDLMLP